MIEKLIGTMFLSREVAHRAHLKTSSYAKHEALGGFYDCIIGLADGLAEAYQGRHGIIDDIPILANDRPNSDIVKILEYHLAVIEKVRYKAVDEKDAALQSLIDDVVNLYLGTLYKLRNLK